MDPNIAAEEVVNVDENFADEEVSVGAAADVDDESDEEDESDSSSSSDDSDSDNSIDPEVARERFRH